MENGNEVSISEKAALNPHAYDEGKIPSVPNNKKSRLLIWDSLGFSTVAIFVISSFYWIDRISFATYIFVAVTSFALFVAGIALLLKSIQIEENKLAYLAIFVNSLLLTYVLFSVMLGVVVSSALSGLTFAP